ncbi:MAG TPA: metal ABC transporter substrate-binding protein [Gemmatimonadaceae bacterium]|nr:metal ABC transporter substrate-binding protein [Gemmatimonadaceae bacterium]
MRYLIAALAAVVLSTPAGAQLRVVTSTTDLADIARAVGGSHVRVTHVSEGYQDPHFAEAKPSFVLQLRNADVFAFVGLDLEAGWMPVLLQGARNPKVSPGGRGHVDVSQAIEVLDRARGKVDRGQGDVHALGNPHYWLDPDNGRRIAELFRTKFAELDAKNAAAYAANAAAFEARLKTAEDGWRAARATIKGKPVVAYHTSWKYLAEYAGLNIVGFMEPKPGVPPSPSHIAGLIADMKRTGAKAIIMEPYYNRKDADFVAARTGATVLVLPPSVGGLRDQKLDTYVDLLKHNIQQIAATVK